MTPYDIVAFVRDQFEEPQAVILLHEPRFVGNERQYVTDAIDSTFVSSVGEYVDRFEQMIAELTGAPYAVATVSGTTALHMALRAAGVRSDDYVITQSLTFVATANAIVHAGATPIFVDVDRATLGLSPDDLETFLQKKAEVREDGCYHKGDQRRIAACVPMHTFGFPADIKRIIELCRTYRIPVVEDAAESLGSTYDGKHTGTFGQLGTFSFNGNKTITAGGGGAIVTDNEELAHQIKHLTTTAKVPHAWHYEHDAVGYNYRMPNLNAALACAQLENLGRFVESKRELALAYQYFFQDSDYTFVAEPAQTYANYWLMTLLAANQEERDHLLQVTNDSGVMTRPAWRPMHHLRMYQDCPRTSLKNTEWLFERIVNLPSSARVATKR